MLAGFGGVANLGTSLGFGTAAIAALPPPKAPPERRPGQAGPEGPSPHSNASFGRKVQSENGDSGSLVIAIPYPAVTADKRDPHLAISVRTPSGPPEKVGQVIDADRRNLIHAQQLGGLDPGVVGQDFAVRVDKYWCGKPELLDARGELLDLLYPMGARVAREGFEHINRPQLDSRLKAPRLMARPSTLGRSR